MTIFGPVTIAASADDARQQGATMNLSGATLNIAAGNVWVIARFTNVTVPAGSTINSAQIRFYLVTNDDPNTTIYGEATDNSAQPTTADNDISSRSLTTASLAWSGTDLGLNAYYAIDISGIVAEICGRAGWVSGNALAIIVDGLAGSSVTIRPYDHTPAQAAELTIDYTAGGGVARQKIRLIRIGTQNGAEIGT
jgi:hypothetical protein